MPGADGSSSSVSVVQRLYDGVDRYMDDEATGRVHMAVPRVATAHPELACPIDDHSSLLSCPMRMCLLVGALHLIHI